MNTQLAALVMAAAAVVLLALMLWGWLRRTRRDATALTSVADLPDDAVGLARFDGFYVATTRQDDPLDRIAAPGFGLPSNAVITVADRGVALDVPGQRRVVIPQERVVDVSQASLAIDRVVERDGLVRLRWRGDPGDVVDTYLRPRNASARALADAIRPLIHDTRTGTPA